MQIYDVVVIIVYALPFHLLIVRQPDKSYKIVCVQQSCTFTAEISLANSKAAFSSFLRIKTKIEQGKSDISHRLNQN